MFSLATAIFGLFMLVLATFWVLFFFVVKVRIADKNLRVREASRFGFLASRWPHEEMRAYLDSLDPSEARTPVNRFLRNANIITTALLAIYILFVTLMMVANGAL